jgi:ribosomal protein S18 acetylase RimI-like enzyme
MKSDLLSDLEFEFSLKPSDMEEFSHLVLEFKGQAIIWDEDAAEEKVVARIKGYRKDETDETPCGGLVYISELMVEPEYRNHSIGTEMMKRMSQVVDMNNTLVALKAVPIVDKENEERTPELKNQLKNFYTKMGFRHSGEHYMIKDARDCYAQRMRTLAESGIKPQQ